MSLTVIYTGVGRICKGELLVDASAMKAAVFRRRDCRVRLTLEKLSATRSPQHNDYYWAVVVARVQAAFKKKAVETGEDPARWDDDELVHDVLKSTFMDPELVRAGKIRGFVSDTGLTIGTHTPDLNKLEFIEYLERIVDHAATAWDCYIPPPDPLWRQHAEQEAS